MVLCLIGLLNRKKVSSSGVPFPLGPIALARLFVFKRFLDDVQFWCYVFLLSGTISRCSFSDWCILWLVRVNTVLGFPLIHALLVRQFDS